MMKLEEKDLLSRRSLAALKYLASDLEERETQEGLLLIPNTS